MPDHDISADVSGVACLAEPVRLALFRFVGAQGDPVSRDDAAAGVGVARHTAKFHLDRLVDEGLLEVEFRRLTGRAGPGAGRPAKLYRRSAREIAVTLPDREYELAGTLMAAAIEDSARTGGDVVAALHDKARRHGHRVGRSVRARAGRRPSRRTELLATRDTLAESGYEPRVEDDAVVLTNCPFHALAHDHTELVCGMNLALMDAVAEGGELRLAAALEPAEGRCCVVLRERR